MKMTYDLATYTMRVESPADPATYTTADTLPYGQSDELDVEVVAQDDDVITVEVNGDSYGIPLFEEEIGENPHLTVLNCDVDVGGGEPQPADERRANEA